MAWDKLKETSFKFFGNSLEPYVLHFDSIKPDLLKSNIGLSLTEYIYVAALAVLGLFAIEFPLSVIVMSLIFGNPILAFLFSFTITIFFMLTVFFLFYSYPSLVAGSRRKEIDIALPFATTYMATIAASGAPPSAIFKVAAEFTEYGELAKESAKINRDIEVFGMDLVGAMRKTAARTPSEDFKELIWGMETVIITGGNLGDFLHQKSRQFIADYRRKLEKYAGTLSLLIEVYLTLILVGSIFFIIMTALFSLFGGGGSQLFLTFIQFVVILVGLPLVSLGFIGVLKTISPVR